MSDISDFRDFIDLRFDVASREQFLDQIAQLARSENFTFVATPNVDHIVRLQEADKSTSPLWPAYRRARLTICDSRILSRLAAMSGIELPTVPGSDLTARIIENLIFTGMHFHVVGGDTTLIQDLAHRSPHVCWTQYQPPQNILCDPDAQAAIAHSVISEGADITFIAIGSPQSELVCSQILESNAARGVALCIGASLEFVTGAKRRAPAAFQRLGLEWLYRLATEPKRLWRRYLIVAPRIFVIWKRWHNRSKVKPATAN